MITLKKRYPITAGAILASPAIIAMPVHTLWFGTRQDPFSYTLSMMGNRFDLMKDFIIWGLVSGVMILVLMLQVFRTAEFRDRKARRSLILSCIFLALTVLTPAVEEVNAFTHKLHFLFASLFALLLSISIFFFLRFLKDINSKLSRRLLGTYLGVLAMSLFLVLFVGANAIFEIFYFMALSVYLLILYRGVRKQTIVETSEYV